MSRQLCALHPGVDYRTAWGCPECVRESRERLEELGRNNQAWQTELRNMTAQRDELLSVVRVVALDLYHYDIPALTHVKELVQAAIDRCGKGGAQ